MQEEKKDNSNLVVLRLTRNDKVLLADGEFAKAYGHFESPRYPWTCYRVFKTAVLCITLVPLIRFILLMLIFLFGVLNAYLGTCCLRSSTKPNPHSCFRRFLLGLFPFYSRATLFVLGFHWIEQKGKRGKEAPVVVANHTAFFDGLFVFSQFTPVVVAADFVRKLPVFGTLLTAAQAIFVNRDDKGDKNYVLNEMKRRVDTPGFNPILIFPEGTTTGNAILGNTCLNYYAHIQFF
eukprot:TRINITY_DN5799_c0_g1_i9.p1 TRINITY_DN5799_c0_g1~~TRINITY_DN5799_c0_g1_i9.p1  ORF type:complete len:235 (+),score=60.60 TRINITY_DN5799_c0_g1_i9:31-735(+)